MSDKNAGNLPERPHGHEYPRFEGISTFARLPHTQQLDGVDAAIFGVPFDGGTSFRPGARFGPQGIRQGSRLIRSYNYTLDVEPLEGLTVIDYGDLAVVPTHIEDTYAMVEKQAAVFHDSGVFPVALGGDHSVTLPLLRASAAKHGRMSLVQVDSHPDTWETLYGKPYNHATVFKRAIEENLIDPTTSFQIGLRGSLPNRDDFERTRGYGITIVTVEDLFARGAEDVASEVLRRVGPEVYFTFDIDFVDPAYAPGTGTPEVGGPSSRQAIDLLRELRGLPLVGFDVVEVSPPYDQSEITAMLAANVVFEALSMVAWQRNHREVEHPDDNVIIYPKRLRESGGAKG
ncbi:MAG TPA: agmatinase [Chloroflexota bacterium]